MPTTYSDEQHKQKASEFVKKWTDRCQSKLTRQTKSHLFDMKVLLCQIEDKGSKKFAFVKRQRLGHVLASCVRAIQIKNEESLAINQATIQKLFGECAREWAQSSQKTTVRVTPDQPGRWLYRSAGASWVLVDVQSNPNDPFSVEACASANVFPGEWVATPV